MLGRFAVTLKTCIWVVSRAAWKQTWAGEGRRKRVFRVRVLRASHGVRLAEAHDAESPGLRPPGALSVCVTSPQGGFGRRGPAGAKVSV